MEKKDEFEGIPRNNPHFYSAIQIRQRTGDGQKNM